jgi:gas vesicle protein
MKKLVLIATTILITGAMSVTAYAAEKTPDYSHRLAPALKLEKRIEEHSVKQKEREERLTERQKELDGLALEINQARLTHLSKAEMNTEAAESANSLRIEILTLLTELSANGKELSEETVNELKMHQENVKALVTSLKETKGEIKTLVEENKEAIKAGDSELLTETTEQISEIQNSRYDMILQINDEYEAMLTLLAIEGTEVSL